MSKKIDSSFIDDIFGIPQDGSNIQDDDNDAFSSLDKGKARDKTPLVPLEEKIKELSVEIAKSNASVVEPVVQKAQEIAQEKPQKKEELVSDIAKNNDVEIARKSVVPADPTSTEEMFGDIFAAEAPPKTEPKIEVTPTPKVETKSQIKVEVKEEAVAKKDVAIPVAPVIEKVEVVTVTPSPTATTLPTGKKTEPLKINDGPRKDRWKLVSPDVKFDYFYEQKRDALENDLLVGGEIDFSKSFKELEEAHVDVSIGETFVAELVSKQMEQVQKWRDRTKLVQLRVNRQYFVWARTIDLFDGLLKRVEYARGKNEGIRYEHMYDMDAYFGMLESLHKSVSAVMDNLDGAFECLSRQVTITMPIKDVERYSKSPTPMTPQLQRYDGLKTNANGSGSITASRPNEAGTPAEPKSPKSGWDI